MERSPTLDPFLDPDDPPPIPPRSPERRVIRQSILNRFAGSRTTCAEGYNDRHDEISHPQPATRLYSQEDNNEGDEAFNQAALHPSPSTRKLNNPYTYAVEADYEGQSAHDKRSTSVESSRSVGSQSQGTVSTIDTTYIHPFGQVRLQSEHSKQDNQKEEVDYRANSSWTRLSWDQQNCPAAGAVMTESSRRVQGVNTLSSSKELRPHDATRSATSNASYTNSHIPTTNRKMRLSPIKESPHKLAHQAPKGFTAGVRKLTGGGGKRDRSRREEKLLKIAIRQNQLLELERRKSLTALYPEPPRLQPSPREVLQPPDRYFIGSRVTRSSSTNGLIASSEEHSMASHHFRYSNKRRLLHSISFWLFLIPIIIGIISIAIAFAVLVHSKKEGQNLEISASMVLWIVCSVFAIIFGTLGCIYVWGMGNPGFVDGICKLGLQELGLVQPFNDDVKRTAEEQEEYARGVRERQERSKERQRLSRRTNSMNTAQLLNPEWQMLYSAPVGSRGELPEVLKSTASRYSGPMKMEYRVDGGLAMTNDKSKAADTTLSGCKTSQNSNEQNVGMQVPRSSDEQVAQGSGIPCNSRSNNTFAPVTPQRRGQKENTPYLLHNRSEGDRVKINQEVPVSQKQSASERSTAHSGRGPNHLLSRLKTRRLAKRLSSEFSISNITLPGSIDTHQPPAKHDLNLTGRSLSLFPPRLIAHDSQIKNKSSTNDLQISPLPTARTQDEHPRNPRPFVENVEDDVFGPSISNYSPLESLARQLNTPELRSLSAEQRAGYFAIERTMHEEREKRAKESLDLVRKNTVRSTLSQKTRSGTMSSAGSHGEGEMGSVERRGSGMRTSRVNSDFSDALDEVVAEAWVGFGSAEQSATVEDADHSSNSSPSATETTPPSALPEPTDLTSFTSKILDQQVPDLTTSSERHRTTSTTASTRPITPSSATSIVTSRNLEPRIMKRVRDLEQREEEVRTTSHGSFLKFGRSTTSRML